MNERTIRTLRVLWLLALLSSPLLCADWARQFLASDNCLDQGGAWDYANERCDFGPGPPYSHASDSSALLPLAAIGFAALGAALLVTSSRGRSRLEAQKKRLGQ
jgi:hypothetical protein